jgi:hypothetical protein
MVDDCLAECGDYADAPIVHVAIAQRTTVSNAPFGQVSEKKNDNNRRESLLSFDGHNIK